MSLTIMYPAKNNSPRTTLAAAISASDTELTLDDATVLPAAPNLIVLGTGDDAEIVSYTTISGNSVTGLVRGVNGTVAGAWPINTIVARNFTAADHEAFRENILDLDTRKSDTGHTHDDRYYTESEIDMVLAQKAPLTSPAFSGTPTAPTASSGTNTMQIATTAFVQSEVSSAIAKEILYFISQTVSVASSAQIMRIPASGTNSAITTNTVVLECTFAAPANITSNVSWQSYAGYVTFSGTCTTATTANVVLGTKGN